MGKIAERLADEIVITSDNPRGEDPVAIIEAIMTGLDKPADATVIEDRATAIVWTIGEAAEGDCVLIAGKGHEEYQEVDGRRRPFSDVAVAMAAAEGEA